MEELDGENISHSIRKPEQIRKGLEHLKSLIDEKHYNKYVDMSPKEFEKIKIISIYWHGIWEKLIIIVIINKKQLMIFIVLVWVIQVAINVLGIGN